MTGKRANEAANAVTPHAADLRIPKAKTGSTSIAMQINNLTIVKPVDKQSTTWKGILHRHSAQYASKL